LHRKAPIWSVKPVNVANANNAKLVNANNENGIALLVNANNESVNAKPVNLNNENRNLVNRDLHSHQTWTPTHHRLPRWSDRQCLCNHPLP
jgi:hypothetical protein